MRPKYSMTDIVKVRLQTTTQYSSALQCATSIFKNEGATAFYKVLPTFSVSQLLGEIDKAKTGSQGDVNALNRYRSMCMYLIWL